MLVINLAILLNACVKSTIQVLASHHHAFLKTCFISSCGLFEYANVLHAASIGVEFVETLDDVVLVGEKLVCCIQSTQRLDASISLQGLS